MMRAPARILIQTTIPPVANDWSVSRFSLLADHLRGLRGPGGELLFEVDGRDREAGVAEDPVLSTLDESDYTQLWLMAVDTGDGITDRECEAIGRFRARGGGLMITRDHMDLGSSICNLAGVGAAHQFHSRNQPIEAERLIDDPFTSYISWPNFHSGANGDFQKIAIAGGLHPVLAADDGGNRAISHLPAHPHEGAVVAPAEAIDARVIATGTSKVTGRNFNLAVAFEGDGNSGRAIAQSTFHHFADYNWDPRVGAPTFVDEPAGDGMLREAAALRDAHRYVANIARWLERLI
jgi:hypothetical protein